MSYRIGSFQLQDVQNDLEKTLRTIESCLSEADDNGLNIVCFPECYLQSYTLDLVETENRAIDLASAQFEAILSRLSPYKVTAIIGLIEREDDSFFNTAIVIRQGKLLGAYRKVHLFEHNFQPGKTYPVFTVDGLTFGINICYDARFAEGAAELTAQGATCIFYPLNNRLPSEKAATYHDMHIPNLLERAIESGCWVISSDVVAQDSTHTGYGCTAIVDPGGQLVSRVKEFEIGMVIAELPQS